MRRLRLTRRALGDLGLDVGQWSAHDAPDYKDEHPVVAKFVESRGTSPTGQEATLLPVTKATVWNLHSERWRGLTWHDEDEDVVWLLGVGWHELGSRDDAYIVLKQRDVDGDLFPTVQDFEDAEPGDIDWFLAAVAEEMPKLLERAHEKPNTEVRDVIADTLTASVMVELIAIEDEEAGETWLGIHLPPNPPEARVLPPEWVMYVVAAAFQDVDVDDLQWGGTFPRGQPASPSEIVVHWPHP